MNKLLIQPARIAEAPATGKRPLRQGVNYPFKRWILVDEKSHPGASVYAAIHNATEPLRDVPDFQKPHRHDQDEFYFFIGSSEGLRGLQGQIKFEGKTHLISSPAGIFIPKGVVHEYKLTDGTGYNIIFFRNRGYSHEEAEPGFARGENESFGRLITSPEIRDASELMCHNSLGPGSRHVFYNAAEREEKIYAMVRGAKHVKAEQPKYVDGHAHVCESYYFFIGDERTRLTGLIAEVRLGSEITTVESPAAVFIPPGVQHSYRLIGGSGQFFNIVLHSEYNPSLVEHK